MGSASGTTSYPASGFPDESSRPQHYGRARWSAFVTSVVVISAVLLAACSSSDPATARSFVPSSKAVVLTNTTTGTVIAEVRDLVEVELTSTSHGPNGAVVPWSAPKSSDDKLLDPHGVVIPPGNPRCPPNATCTFFRAAGAGSVAIGAIAPSGIICATPGGGCVGITEEFQAHDSAVRVGARSVGDVVALAIAVTR